MGKLDGRVALITGAASGLGRATAAMFAAEGATVIVADLNVTSANEVAAALSAAGGKAHAEPLDVTSGSQCRDIMTSIDERFGHLDILMTCAGIGDSAQLSDLDEETFDRVIAVNLKGTFLCIKFAMPLLMRQGGSIIGLGSVAGIVGNPGFASYGASKAAVITSCGSWRWRARPSTCAPTPSAHHGSGRRWWKKRRNN